MKKILFLTFSLLFLPVGGTFAQNSNTCQSPQPGEYLVFVANQTDPSQLKRNLPPYTKAEICQYLNNIVTRVSGYKSLEDANNSATYLNQIIGLQAFVVAPKDSIKPSNPTITTGYQPQPLTSNYAVLIDYFNKPELASKVKQLLGNDVGLVVYGQRPYLLAITTDDPSEANRIFLQLSNSGYWSKIVNGRKVILLKGVVNYQ